MLNDFHLAYGNTAGLVATEAAYRHGNDWLRQLIDYIEGNISWLSDYLKNYLPEIRMIHPEATYLVWLDFRELGLSRNELKKFLIREAGIGLSDGALFGTGGEGFQRLNVACPRSLLEKGMDQLKKAIKR
jgi:cystathionine beta-lyase